VVSLLMVRVFVGSTPMRKKIESWRLAHPSTVYLYHNDCMITTFLGLLNSGGPYYGWTAPEDEWRNLYVGAIVQHSDYRWDIDTGYGAPGAPVRNTPRNELPNSSG